MDVRNAYQLALALVLTSLGPVEADTLQLKSGDRLQGSVIRQDAKVLEFEATSFGQTLTVPLDAIESLERVEASKPEPTRKEALTSVQESVVEAVTSKPTPKLELPENWDAQVSFGYADRDGQARSREVSAEGKVAWKHEKNEAEWTGHYRYFEHEAKKAADRYGLAQRLRHRGDDGLFLQSVTKGEVDNVTKNRTQLTQTAALGYSPLKKETLKVNIAPGLKAEYIADAEKKSQEGTSYKANLNQDLSWQVNDQVAVGQGLSYSVDPSDDANWDLDFNAFVETKVNEDMKMRLNYRRDFLNETEGRDDKESAELGASLVWDF